MNWNSIVEITGYIGSALVLLSFLMTSVIKLRVFNCLGSIVSFIYAMIIKAYPTALMNFFLIIINAYFLYKSTNFKREYALVEVKRGDPFMDYLVREYADDIQSVFPGVSLDFKTAENCYIICCHRQPVAFTITTGNKEETELLLDYSIPEYRDYSVGEYLYGQFKSKGIKKLVYRGPADNHTAFLKKMGYQQKDGYYVKNL